MIGTPGALAPLRDHVRVGAQPSKGELIRALADFLLVGVHGYHEKYLELAALIATAVASFEAAGMKVVNSDHRLSGSTVFGIEDPNAVLTKQLKKRGHSPMFLFALCPKDPRRCQYGFQLSLTPHCLRQVDKRGRSALEVFVADLLEVHAGTKRACLRRALANRAPTNSLLAILLSGGSESTWILSLVSRPGFGRAVSGLINRRLLSAFLDSGLVARSRRSCTALEECLRRFFGTVVILMLVLAQMRRKRGRKAKLF